MQVVRNALIVLLVLSGESVCVGNTFARKLDLVLRCCDALGIGCNYMSKQAAQKPTLINFENLGERISALTKAHAGVLSEAATRCLSYNKHNIPVTLKVEGLISGDIQVIWTKCTKRIERCYNDLQYATEQGACGVSLLLIETFTEYTTIERSRKGTGFDYWLGKKGELFQKKARLEVSGIISGNAGDIERRRKLKVKQTQVTKGKLPAIIIIVEFGAPASVVCKDE